MKTCRFCEEIIGDQDEICGNCGYNFKTDTLTASFVKKEQKSAAAKNPKTVSPAVKTFMFWGIILVVVALGFQYQMKIGDFFWGLKNIFSGNKASKSAQAQAKANQKKIIRLMDVSSYEAPVDKTPGKNKKIEGIFYDPRGQSYVVINGQLIPEQGSFGNMVIKKINSDSIEVDEDGTEKVITVNK